MTTTTNPGAHVLDVVYLCDQDGLEHDSYHQRDADGAFLCAQRRRVDRANRARSET